MNRNVLILSILILVAIGMIFWSLTSNPQSTNETNNVSNSNIENLPNNQATDTTLSICQVLEQKFNTFVSESQQQFCSTDADCTNIPDMYTNNCQGACVKKDYKTTEILSVQDEFKSKNCLETLYPGQGFGCGTTLTKCSCLNNKCVTQTSGYCGPTGCAN